jgi:hypothetical protein
MIVTENDRRKLWRQWLDATSERYRAWAAAGYPNPRPATIPIPAECIDMRCGARTRAGTPCKRKDIYRSGRCKLHGGLSTGPKSEAGKAKASHNGRRRTP